MKTQISIRGMKNRLGFMTIKNTIIFLLFLASSSSIWAHPDGAKPFWYPSSFIYGFIKGCSLTVERERPPIIEKLWPDEIRNVCGCVMDSLRHSFTFQESIAEGRMAMQLIVNATMPVCMDEQHAKKGDKSVRVQPDIPSD